MTLVITVKMVADSKDELPEVPAKVIEVRNHFGNLAKEGILGPPAQVSVRYLIENRE